MKHKYLPKQPLALYVIPYTHPKAPYIAPNPPVSQTTAQGSGLLHAPHPLDRADHLESERRGTDTSQMETTGAGLHGRRGLG